MKLNAVKLGALALLATTAACSCIDAPDLDIAPVSVSKKYNGTDRERDVIASNRLVSGSPVASADAGQIVGLPLNKVFFDYNSAALTPTAQSSLKDVYAYARSKNVSAVTVEGHADERGTREYNLALGDRRAVAMKRYLTSLGMPANAITTVSFGKERPATNGHNEAAWAQNRRGVVVFK